MHILILNGHDGNIPALEVAARNVENKYKEASIIYVPAWWEITGEKMKEDFEVWDGLGHGGEGETSIMMAIRPNLVDLDEVVCQMPHDMIRLSKYSLVMFDISELTNTGAIGDPTKATVEKGEKMLEIVVDDVVEFIRDLEK
ncbi:MAG TPA: creatininase family protein [Bacillota bacterium]